MAGHRLPPPPLCPAEAVCLRGDMTARTDGTHVLEGEWAANKMTLTKGGLKNPFKNESPGLPGQPIPRDGTYSGYFYITEGGKFLKQVDDVMELRFQKNAMGGYNIEGSADNIYGHFNVTGTITPSGRAELFKAMPALSGAGGAAAATGSGGGRQRGAVNSGSGSHSGGSSRNSKGSRASPPPVAPVPAAAAGGGLGSAGPVTPQAAEAFRELLRTLKSRDNSHWFFVAVDPVLHEAPGYFDVVHQPMDLSLVGEKLDRGEYNSRDEFYTDARLVFKNALTYNTNPMSLIRKAAVNFNKTLGTHIRRTEESLGNFSFRGIGSGGAGGGSFNKNRPQARSSPTLPRPASSVGGSSAAAPVLKTEAYSGMDMEPPPAEPLSLDEQRDLAKKIDEIFKRQRIEEEKCHAYVVWQFITRRVSAENRKREGDQIVLDVDLLTPEAGRELLSICDHFLNSRRAHDNMGAALPGTAPGAALAGSGKRPAAAVAGSAAEADNAAEAALEAALAANLYDGDEDDEEEEEDEVVQRKRPKVDADNGGTSSDEEAQFDASAPAARQIERQENRIGDVKPATAKNGGKTPQTTSAAAAASDAVAGAEAAIAGAAAAVAGAEAAAKAASAVIAAAAADDEGEEEEASAAEEASESASHPDANASAAAWGEMEDEEEEDVGGGGAGDEDGDGGGGGGGDDGWERARLEKLEKERRQREREEKEVALAEEQRLRQAAREREIAEEAERQRRQREEDEKREADEAERRAKEEEIRRAKKKEEERKTRQAMGQDVDLDEVRGDAELMELMDDAEGFD